MRDIKFRGMAVHPYKKQWWYGYYVKSDYMGKSFITSNAIEAINHEASGAIAFAHFCEVDPGTVGQYTGLKDKNGVEIYEGDIVRVYFVTETADGDRVTDYSGVVQFGVFKIDYYGEEASTVSGWYFNSKDGQSKFWDENSLAECNESCVIIGNIHENPNLLK